MFLALIFEYENDCNNAATDFVLRFLIVHSIRVMSGDISENIFLASFANILVQLMSVHSPFDYSCATYIQALCK